MTETATASARLVVGVDGSAQSVDALRWAIHHAELLGGIVEAVIAWEPLGASGWAWGPVAMAVDFDYAGDAAKVLEDAISQATGPGTTVEIRRVVTEGPAARVLVEASEGATLLVVGSRGHGGFAEVLLGSVSQQCAHHARCPVVITRGRESHVG